MSKHLSEKILVFFLFVTAFVFFYVANEDAKELGVLKNTSSVIIPSSLTSAQEKPAESKGNLPSPNP